MWFSRQDDAWTGWHPDGMAGGWHGAGRDGSEMEWRWTRLRPDGISPERMASGPSALYDGGRGW